MSHGFSQSYLSRLIHVLEAVDHEELDNGIAQIHHAWRRGTQIITLGNGGSAMTAQHFVTDWAKMVPAKTGKVFLGRSLIDNMGLVMAYGNDVSFSDIFVEQLRNILRPKDLVVAISGSGNSENVIRAVDYANANGAVTLGLCGYSGGSLRKKAQHVIWIRVDDMQLCEDAHAIFGHIVMQRLCEIGMTTNVTPNGLQRKDKVISSNYPTRRDAADSLQDHFDGLVGTSFPSGHGRDD